MNSLNSSSEGFYLDTSPRFPLAVQPTSPYIAFGIGHNQVEENDSGLYDRTDITHDTESATTNLADWQRWVQTGWKTPHGSDDAVARFTGKLQEEYDEFSQATNDFNAQKTLETKAEFLAEAGDFVWCIGALASSASVDLARGIQEYLYGTAMDISYVDGRDGTHHVPRWRDSALAVATKRDGPVTFSDIQDLIEASYVTEPTNKYGPFYIRDEFDVLPTPQRYVLTMATDTKLIVALAQKQYGMDGQDREFVGNVTYQALGREVQQLAARMILQTAYVVSNMADTTLQSVVMANIEKVNARIAAGRVDKTDGVRV